MEEYPEIKDKKCPYCGIVKLFYEFYIDTKRKDGHSYFCRECSKEIPRIKRANKQKLEYKVCSICGEIKSIKDFIYLKNHTGRSGGSKICHSCYNLKLHPVKILPEYKTCTSCREIKPFKEFIYKGDSGTRGGRKLCISCYHLSAAKYSRENADLQKYQKYYNRHQSQLKHIQDKLRYINDCFCRLHGYNRKLIYKQKSRSENRLDKLSELIKNDLSNIHRIQKENIINPK